MLLISFFPSDHIRDAHPASAPAPRLYAHISLSLYPFFFTEGSAKTLFVLCNHARELTKHFSVLPVQETRALRQPPISLASLSLAAIGGRSRRFLISVVDHRRPGSRLKQCFAMSSNGCGTFSGNLGSFLFRSIPRRQTIRERLDKLVSSVTRYRRLGDIAPARDHHIGIGSQESVMCGR